MDFECHCSYLEIYNEQISDLLVKDSASLQLRDDNKKGIYVEGLSEKRVHSTTDAMSVLNAGSLRRCVY
jgi:hypothetical protein